MLLVTVLMSSISLTKEEQQVCHQVARDSIEHGLLHGKKLTINTDEYPQPLQQKLASFVTLHIDSVLRGCIGALEAYQPLINDVSEHAFAAAFSDPRFPALTNNEFDLIDIEISVLGKPELVMFEDEEDLLNKIRPGIDGLILESGYHRGTFLPSVWEQLPEKNDFLQHLKMKAGLAIDWWDNNAKVSRYETFSF